MAVKPCSCSFCVRLCRWFPVFFIFVVIMWSYYVYMFELCLILVATLWVQVTYIACYHIFFFIFVFSYLKCILEPEAPIPHEFHFTDEEWIQLAHTDGMTGPRKNSLIEGIVDQRALPVYMVAQDGYFNVCYTCRLIKPDRAHHCSTCKRCVLKLDHHCPWTNSCIGFHNHKYFVIFLAWGTLYCLYVAATAAPYFHNFFPSSPHAPTRQFQVLFLLIVAVMFCICQVSLAGYHVYLISLNRSTLETFAAPKFRYESLKGNVFDMGRLENMRETFGSNWFLALLPINTTRGDGVHWHYKDFTSDQAESVLGTAGHFGGQDV